MKPALARIIPNEAFRHRRRYESKTKRHHLTLLLGFRDSLAVADLKSGKMPTSWAQLTRRRIARECDRIGFEAGNAPENFQSVDGTNGGDLHDDRAAAADSTDVFINTNTPRESHTLGEYSRRHIMMESRSAAEQTNNAVLTALGNKGINRSVHPQIAQVGRKGEIQSKDDALLDFFASCSIDRGDQVFHAATNDTVAGYDQPLQVEAQTESLYGNESPRRHPLSPLYRRSALNRIETIPQSDDFEFTTHTTEAAQSFSSDQTDSAPLFNSPGSMTADFSGSTSPNVESDLFDRSPSYSHDFFPSIRGGRMNYEGIGEDEGAIIYPPREIKSDLVSFPHKKSKDYTFYHRRVVSSGLTPSTKHKASVPLRARRWTNDGLLAFQANASKNTPFESRIEGHRRKMSLKLPIRMPSDNLAFPPPTVPTSPQADPENATTASKKAECELEYIHRHTFIGTASLDDFLEVLELSPSQTTTKRQAAKAFIYLASMEQIQARQASSTSEGWESVSRITQEVTCADYVSQAQVKLGSITLMQFLRLIPFDGEEKMEAIKVVKAFCVASHLDSKARAGTGSKARAFRSWMVRQNTENK